MFTESNAAPGAAEPGEEYFVSMTDMMVGMLFLFIILLMVFALNYRVSDSNAADVRNCLVKLLQANATLSDQINAKVNKIQANVRRGLEALEFAADQRRRLVLDLRETLRNEGITVDVDERNGVKG